MDRKCRIWIYKTPASPILMNVVYNRIVQYGKRTKNTQIVKRYSTEKVGERLEALVCVCVCVCVCVYV